MDLNNVPQQVWDLLANEGIFAVQERRDVCRAVDDYFYKRIYSRWAIEFQTINYTANLEGVIDVGWDKLANMWDGGKESCLHPKDIAHGYAMRQAENNDPTHGKTRLGEVYSDAECVSRFQFLVASGGGMVLLNRMRRACQSYIEDKKFTVVQWWKVFGESFAEKGQSDACVVYLLVMHDDPRVAEFIEKYLWPNIKDIVDDRIVPVGLVQVANKPLWATWLPSPGKWGQVLGGNTLNTHYGSAGGLMGLVLGLAFADAVTQVPGLDAGALIASAKGRAAHLLEQLAS